MRSTEDECSHLSPNFSTWELFPVSCNLDLFSFQCHLHWESKNPVPGEYMGFFYIPGQHFQHFVLELKKEARQSPAWVSSLDEANKCHFVLACATQAAAEGGTGRSRQTRDLKAEGWFGDWTSWGLRFRLLLIQSSMQRGGTLVPQFSHCKVVNVLPTPITGVLIKVS